MTALLLALLLTQNDKVEMRPNETQYTQYKTIPSCSGSNQCLNWNSSTDALSCQTLTGSGLTATDLNCTGCVSDAELASNYSGTGSCAAASYVSGLNDNAAPTCTSLGHQILDTTYHTNASVQGAQAHADLFVFDTDHWENFPRGENNDAVLHSGTGAALPAWRVVPDCTAATCCLQYNQSADSWGTNTAISASTLTANPTDCAANQYANAIAASGNLTCSQVTTAQLSGTITDAQLASNYSGTGACSSSTIVTGTNDNTAPTCSTLDDNRVPNLSWTAFLAADATCNADLETGGEFCNSWTNFGGGFTTGSYTKDLNGVVCIRGLSASGTITAGTPVANLPTGWRPTAQHIFPARMSGGASEIRVQTDGDIVCGDSACNATWTSLDGICFSTN